MLANEIKNALYARGYEQSMLAEVLGVSPGLVSKVIQRKAKSFRVARAVARVIEKDVFDVFPELARVREVEKATKRTAKLEKLRAELANL